MGLVATDWKAFLPYLGPMFEDFVALCFRSDMGVVAYRPHDSTQLKLQISFAKEPYTRDYILAWWPIGLVIPLRKAMLLSN